MCSVDKRCPDILAPLVNVVDDDDDTKTPYACTLNQTDLVNNCNKFCILQLLTRANEIFFIYTRAGRVGYDGPCNLDGYMSRDEAVKEFKTLFHDRTGIQWSARYDMKDEPTPSGKYQYVLMKYDNAVTHGTKKKQDIKGLSEPVVDLVETIYDPNLYNSAAKSYGIDVNRLPLGNLGKSQVEKAYKILGAINDICKNQPSGVCDLIDGSPDNDVLVQLSSQYYSTIPTACGMSKLPVIHTCDMVKEKIELLDLLDDMSCLNVSSQDIYSKYVKLQCDITPLTDSKMIDIITRYLCNNRGSTHSMRLNPRGIFCLDKLNEKTRYRKWDTLHNKQLLWHGTRLANAVGILTQGLKINPVGVPTTGKMFGNGLYFANASTKSAQYMGCSHGDIGLLFLCEVALGNMYERYQSEHITKLPQGKHSTRGLGSNQPDESTHVEIGDNVIVPIGKLKATKDAQTRSLLYDEFIVYDISQIKLKYLVLVDYS